MNILFEKIRFKNFLSFGNNWTEIDFTSNQTTTIIGKNGGGKSTIMDSICFSLYGKPYRKINKPQLINTINDKNLLTEIEFKVGPNKFKVRRGLKPSIFEIYKNGDLIPQDSKSLDYQTHLEKDILKMSFKSFCQIVIIGSASWTPFMQLPAGQRREIIEDLLDQQIFTKMNSILSNKISELKTNEYENKKEHEILKEKIKLYTKTIEEANQNIEQELNNCEVEHKENEKSLKEIKSSVFKLNDELKEYKKRQEKYEILLMREKEILSKVKAEENSIEKLKEEIKFYETKEICPKCKGKIEENHKKKEIESAQNQIEEIENRLKVAYRELEEIRNQENYFDFNSSILEKTAELRSYKEKYSIIQERFESNEKRRKHLLQKKNVQLETTQKDLDTLKEDFSKKDKEKDQIQEQKDLYKKAQVLLKDNGIKAKIISKTIPVINKTVNKYLEQMDMFISFELDETFNETIKSRFLESYSYNNFSEGEKSRINLALLFAWREISSMRSSASTNLLFLDEIFDGPLDNEGSEIFANIIKGLTKDNNVFIITHNENFIDKFNAVMRVVKKNNFSLIE